MPGRCPRVPISDPYATSESRREPAFSALPKTSINSHMQERGYKPNPKGTANRLGEPGLVTCGLDMSGTWTARTSEPRPVGDCDFYLHLDCMSASMAKTSPGCPTATEFYEQFEGMIYWLPLQWRPNSMELQKITYCLFPISEDTLLLIILNYFKNSRRFSPIWGVNKHNADGVL
ncbi:hypothetical protein BGZ63DRAFT_442099 [Mariannaea sp. PMI_226]|nr:hypothetical protein BGZ63DRAFT_442099 [Mariannaea sp. PMI_226]